LMPYWAAKDLSACGESAGWLKPMLITLNRPSPRASRATETAFCSARVVVGQT
jgi:hypothetical protein